MRSSANHLLWTLATTPSTMIVPDAVKGLKRPLRRSVVTLLTRNSAVAPPSAQNNQRIVKPQIAPQPFPTSLNATEPAETLTVEGPDERAGMNIPRAAHDVLAPDSVVVTGAVSRRQEVVSGQ